MCYEGKTLILLNRRLHYAEEEDLRPLSGLEKHRRHADIRLKLEDTDVFIDDSGIIHMPLFAAAFVSQLDAGVSETMS
jgi:hypothetical protein